MAVYEETSLWHCQKFWASTVASCHHHRHRHGRQSGLVLPVGPWILRLDMCATGISFDLHPQNLTWVAKKRGWMEDVFPFQMGDFQGPCYFSVVYIIYGAWGYDQHINPHSAPGIFKKHLFERSFFWRAKVSRPVFLFWKTLGSFRSL